MQQAVRTEMKRMLNENKSDHTKYRYKVNGVEYMVPNIGIQVKLWDFDFACIPGIVDNAKVDAEWTKKIQDTAISIFKKLKCKGLARVDFFFNEKTQSLYFNEVNTMPGFTAISLYPSMWAKSGKNYSQLLASLIETAIFQHDARKNLMTDYHD